MKKWLAAALAALMLLLSTAFAEPNSAYQVLVDEDIAEYGDIIVEYGYDYSLPEEVALYLHAFVELPPNYITKSAAMDLGWDSRSGNLWEVTYEMSIGGDIFGNREGLLPKKRGRTWYECDVNYYGGYRGSERIVFSNDGLIYYTASHYQNFELMYDGWYEEDAEYVPYTEE